MQLPSGTLTDTLGPRKTVAAGLLLSTFASFLPQCVLLPPQRFSVDVVLRIHGTILYAV